MRSRGVGFLYIALTDGRQGSRKFLIALEAVAGSLARSQRLWVPKTRNLPRPPALAYVRAPTWLPVVELPLVLYIPIMPSSRGRPVRVREVSPELAFAGIARDIDLEGS